MQLKAKARALAMVAAAAAVAACQQFSPDNDTRTLSFNHAVAASTNQLLLLNIVRDAQRAPTYFSRLGSNSAQSTLSPSLAMTFPFGVFSAGQAVLTPQATAQNLLTLENLDDKKYQDGAMARIDASRVADFWDEGIQPDTLGLLFFSRIELPAEELALVVNGVNAVCGDHGTARNNKYCAAVTRKPAPEAFDTSRCLRADQIPLVQRNGRPYAVYINDPAWEYGSKDSHPALCFQFMLRNLLALGLHPATRKGNEEVDEKIPGSVLTNGEFRADMIKNGFKVGKNDAGTAIHVTKDTQETVFALDATATYEIRSASSYPSAVLRCHEQTPGNLEDECKAVSHRESILSDKISAKVISTSEIKIGIAIRSFEGVVYYLGEVVRAENIGIDSQHAPYFPTIVGRAPWGGAPLPDEALFEVLTGSPHEGAPVIVKDDRGQTYWIPDFCNDAYVPGPSPPADSQMCGAEYPNHESLTVLTLVNQIWGLQKEPSASPEPTISVGGH